MNFVFNTPSLLYYEAILLFNLYILSTILFAWRWPCEAKISRTYIYVRTLNLYIDFIFSFFVLVCKLLFNGTYHFIIKRKSFTFQVVLKFWNQKLIRWCWIRKIERIINQFKTNLIFFLRRNQHLVSRKIVLQKENTFGKFFAALFYNFLT